MSAGHLSREFRRAYGESPYAYLMTRRIERAMALLRCGDLSVTEQVTRPIRNREAQSPSRT
jgi:AraC-like DNA-binding protein